MTKIKKIFLVAVAIMLAASLLGIFVYVSNVVVLNESTKDNNVLSKPIAIENSGYTLSEVNIIKHFFKDEYILVFTGNVPEKISTNPNPVPMLYYVFNGAPSMEPYITYQDNKDQKSLKFESFYFNHVKEIFKLGYNFSNLPKNINSISVTGIYKNNSGQSVKFTTPKIELLR
ncbi:MAG: hypothetical protein HQK53_04360 [Oligoflexia bacterium]|nr:hypothetical protein [Oligoflexia bacterium]